MNIKKLENMSEEEHQHWEDKAEAKGLIRSTGSSCCVCGAKDQPIGVFTGRCIECVITGRKNKDYYDTRTNSNARRGRKRIRNEDDRSAVRESGTSL